MIDEDDRIFYDTAKQSESILITFNEKHFRSLSDIKIMTPGQFLIMFRKQSESSTINE